MTLFQQLQELNIPVAYGLFDTEQTPPYMIYMGDGQDQFEADNTYYITKNRYQLEYYFTKKDEIKEQEIEALLLKLGYHYEKSEDIYLDDQKLYMIYYNI